MTPSRGRRAGSNIGTESLQIGPVSTGFIFPDFDISAPEEPPLDQSRRLGHVADLGERQAARNQTVVGVGDRRQPVPPQRRVGWPSSLGVEGIDRRCAHRFRPAMPRENPAERCLNAFVCYCTSVP
jgi:hypothetical protein